MTIADFITKLKTMDQSMLVLTCDDGYVPKLYTVTLHKTRFVEAIEDGIYRDVTDCEREQEIVALIL